MRKNLTKGRISGYFTLYVEYFVTLLLRRRFYQEAAMYVHHKEMIKMDGGPRRH